jgi:TP901 family phage tail tape measure protein
MKAFTIPSVYTAVDKFSSPVKKMVNVNQQFTNSLETGVARGERWFRKLTPAIGETTKQLFSFVKAAAIATAILGVGMFTLREIKQFDKSLASLRSITGKTKEEFEPFRAKIIEVARDAKKSTTETVGAFEKIAALNAEFLESAEAIGAVSKATILLSKASGDELGPSAESLVGIMNQFSLAADQADRTVNVLAAGAGVGAAGITQIAEAYKNFGSVAASSNISLEQSTALIEVLGKFTILGAEAGTKLRGAVLKLQQAGVGYASGQFQINDALEDAKRKIDKLKTAKQKDALINKMFGAENVTTGRILLNNIDLYKQFTTAVTGTDAAYKQAEINSDTLATRLDEVSAAWVNVFTGSQKTTAGLEMVKNAAKFVSENMATIVDIGAKILLFFAAWKAVLIVSRIALVAYNVVLGVMGALSGTASVAIGANTVALGAYKVALAIATAAQWALNVALTANPIGVIIVAIAALIALVVVVIAKWNEWGAALTLFMGPLGLIISMVMSFRRNWDMITKAFKEGGILAGLKAIGATLLDAVLMPIQQIVELIAEITGAEWANNAVKNIQDFRKGIGVQVDEKVNPKQSEQEGLSQRIEKHESQNVAINIKDQTGRASFESDNDLVPVRLSSTWGPM